MNQAVKARQDAQSSGASNARIRELRRAERQAQSAVETFKSANTGVLSNSAFGGAGTINVPF